MHDWRLLLCICCCCTGAVLGSTPWVLGAAVSGQLCRLVLNDAAGLADLAAAALLGAYSWKRLEQLEIEGAKVNRKCDRVDRVTQVLCTAALLSRTCTSP